MDIKIILIFIVIIVIFLIIIFIIYQNNLKQQLFLKDIIHKSEILQNKQIENFSQQLSNDLIRFQALMSNSINEDLNRLNENTNSKLLKMEKGVNEGLLFGFNKTNESYNNVLKQVERISEVSDNLKEISLNITNFQNIFTDKKTRGIFGEISLYNVLDNAFGNNNNFYLKQHKLSNGFIVDCLLLTPSPLNNIVIDAKFPLENYNRLFDNNLNQKEIKNNFKKDVIKHINDIKSKYLIPNETADIAYMFIPAEAVFAKIYGEFDEIVQASYKAKVYLVSPTTLMAYVTAIKAIYLDQKRNEKAIEIQKEFDKLSHEFIRFNERFNIFKKDFEKVYQEMSGISITATKIINRFKQIEAVDISGEEHGKI